MNTTEAPESHEPAPLLGLGSSAVLGPNVPERAGFLAQIEACRRDVAQWPEWMKATSAAPKWMEGWDD